MRKTLAIILLITLFLGITGLAFAEGNPFATVPANHWAYASITKLVKAGLVDGYGDGDFRGDKPATRYEMATLTAKAMFNWEKADAQNKAEIVKLQKEFGDELTKLGVRVTALEKNQPNLKFTGAFTTRYTAQGYDNGPGKNPDDANAQYRLRLDATAKVDANTTFGMRFVTSAPDNTNFKDDSWIKFGTNTNTNSSATSNTSNAIIDRAFLTTKLGIVNATVGRQGLWTDANNMIIDSTTFNFDGVKLAANFDKSFSGFVNYGRFTNLTAPTATILAPSFGGTTTSPATGSAYKNYWSSDVITVGLNYKQNALNAGINYTSLKNNRAGVDLDQWYSVNAGYLFNPQISAFGEYVKNDHSGASGHDTAYLVGTLFGDQTINDKGKKNLKVRYYHIGRNAIVERFTNLDKVNTNNFGSDYKAWDATATYGFSPNFYSELIYAKLTDQITSGNSYHYWRTTLNVKF